MNDPNRVYREKDLRGLDGMGPSQRDEKIKNGEYPSYAKVFDGGRAKIWFGDEIAAWQAWRRAKRDGTAAKGSSWRDYLIEPNAFATTKERGR
jgi:hypothetical protein